MNTIIRWAEPPASIYADRADRAPRRAEVSPWTDVVNELRAAPYHWAVIYEGNQGQASGIAQAVKQGAGRGEAFAPRGAYEAVTRSIDGTVCTFARFIGEPSPEVKR